MCHVSSTSSHFCGISLDSLPLLYLFPEGWCPELLISSNTVLTNRLLEVFHVPYKHCCCLYIPGTFNFPFLFYTTITLLAYGQLIITTTTCKAFSIQLQPTQLFACLSPVCSEDYSWIHTKICVILLELHSFLWSELTKHSEERSDGAGHRESTMACNTGRLNSIMQLQGEKNLELFKILLSSASPWRHLTATADNSLTTSIPSSTSHMIYFLIKSLLPRGKFSPTLPDSLMQHAVLAPRSSGYF